MSLQSTDPIADLLTRIRNAIAVGKNEVRLPSSKLKVTVAKELVRTGYLADVKVEKQSPRDELVVTIYRDGGTRLSLRLHVSANLVAACTRAPTTSHASNLAAVSCWSAPVKAL